jgi:hypothetical protein
MNEIIGHSIVEVEAATGLFEDMKDVFVATMYSYYVSTAALLLFLSSAVSGTPMSQCCGKVPLIVSLTHYLLLRSSSSFRSFKINSIISE